MRQQWSRRRASLGLAGVCAVVAVGCGPPARSSREPSAPAAPAVTRPDRLTRACDFTQVGTPGGATPHMLVQAQQGERVDALRFSRDGRYLASLTSGSVHLWDLSANALVAAMPVPQASTKLARVGWEETLLSGYAGSMTPQGRVAPGDLGPLDYLEQLPQAWGGGEWVGVRDGKLALASKARRVVKELTATSPVFPTALRVSRTGRYVLTYAGRRLTIFDLQEGVSARDVEFAQPVVQLSAAESTAVVATGGLALHVVTLSTGALSPLKLADPPGQASESPAALALVSDGRLVAASSSRFALHSLEDGRVLWSQPRPTTGVSSLEVSTDGSRFAVGTTDGGTQVYSSTSGRHQSTLGSELAPARDAWLGDADELYVAAGQRVSRWSLKQATRGDSYPAHWPQQIVPQHTGKPWALNAYSSADCLTVRVLAPWDFDFAAATRALRPRALTLVSQSLGVSVPGDDAPNLRSICEFFRQDAQLLAHGRWAGTSDNHEFEVVTFEGARVPLENPIQSPLDFGMSEDGSRIWALHTRGVVVWNASGKIVASVTGDLRTASITANGARLALAAGNQVTVVEATGTRTIDPAAVTSLPIATPEAALLDPVTALRFLPDNDSLFVATGAGNRYLVAQGKVVGQGSGGGAAARISIDKTGTRAAVVSKQGQVEIWDLRQVRLVATLFEFADDEWLITTPSGVHQASFEASDRVGWVFGDRYVPFQHLPNYRCAAGVARALAGAPLEVPSPAVPPLLKLDATSKKSETSQWLSFRVEAATQNVSVRAFVEGAYAGEVKGGSGKSLGLEVALKDGPNRVNLVAIDENGAVSSMQELKLVGSRPRSAPPDLWVLSVGLGRYPRMPASTQLRVADDDAVTFARAMHAYAGPNKSYRHAHVKLITDTDEFVTPEVIESAMEELRQAKPDDLVIVLLAGHGVHNPDGDMVFLTSLASNRLASLPDSSIGWSRIKQALQSVRARTLLLLDACHAGHLTRDQMALNDQLAAEMVRDSTGSLVAFAAAKGRQFSHENGWGGYFTTELIASLAEPATDADGDGWIQLTELTSSVTSRVQAESNGDQAPWVARRQMFGDYRLFPAGQLAQ